MCGRPAGRRLLYSPFLYTHIAATQNGDRGVVLLVLSSSLSLSLSLTNDAIIYSRFFFLTWQQLGNSFFLYSSSSVSLSCLSRLFVAECRYRAVAQKKKRERIEMFFLLFLFFLWPLVDCDNTTKHDTHRRL